MGGMEPRNGEGELRELRPDDPREVSGYLLEARIGEGGMGTVYLSRTRGNRPLALKVIRREFAEDPQFRRRFAQEAQAARRVAGYHLVPVLDHDTDAEQPWIATAYQPGLSLQSVLDGHGPLPTEAALQATGCVARALQAVHAAGYVHRDIKPSNVLISADGPWVIDFGIARSADSTGVTVTGGMVGTPRFMSPEHARGQELGPASDVFSLGLLAAVTASGRHPYGDASGIGMAALIAGTDTTPPELDGYPEPLRRVLRATLAPDPAQRPNAAEIAEMCEEAAGRSLTDFGDWLPEAVAAAVDAAATEVAAVLRRPMRPGRAPAPPAPVIPAGFGPPPSMDPVPAATVPSPATGRRSRTLTAVLTTMAVVAAAYTGTMVWRAASGTGGDGQGTEVQQPRDGGKNSPEHAEDGKERSDGVDDVPYAPEGYELLFANKPFTFAPPKREDQANHLDFDVPRATYVQRGALLGPAELGYNTDGWLGSMLVVVGERKTVCTEEQQTAVLPHPLPAAELRLGRQIKVGTILCAITSNDNVAEARITEIIPGRGENGLPTYKGYITSWERPLDPAAASRPPRGPDLPASP